MLKKISSVVSSVSSVLDFNEATLSGCVDIIVVPQKDGTLKSTPFHVRFGKLKLLKCTDKIVHLHVNNVESKFVMKLGDAGEGFFERQIFKPIYSPPKLKVLVDEEKNNSPQEQPLQEGIVQNMNLLASPQKKNGGKEERKTMEKNSSQATGGVTAVEEDYDPYEELEQMLNDENPDNEEERDRIKEQFQRQINSNNKQDRKGKARTPSPDKKRVTTEVRDGKTGYVKIKRTLRPSSEMLHSLNLKPGLNTITYTVFSSFQGRQMVTGHIYLWPMDAKIIISDVDGTITKSDVLGHLLPMIGRDWSQPGIAPLYCNIRRNGYHIMYLTARAIGQSQLTKDFIYSVYQDEKMMPHGPVVMSPDRVFASMKREVVYRRPEVFKIATLRDIKKLFPADHSPFHVGFGNRETDTIAYKAVGVAMDNIFIVDPKGTLMQYQSDLIKSYAMLNSKVKDWFPFISKNKSPLKIDYSASLSQSQPEQDTTDEGKESPIRFA